MMFPLGGDRLRLDDFRACLLDYWTLEGDAFPIVLKEPPLCGLGIGEDLEMIGITDLLHVST
jgi:hypothetical protein